MGANDRSPVETPFAATLAELREARGLSQSRLAHESGFDHSYVSRLENGKREASRDTINTFAEVMDLSGRERDRLLIAGGFAPSDPAALLADLPAVAEAVRLLRDPALPAWQRHAYLTNLAALNRLGEHMLRLHKAPDAARAAIARAEPGAAGGVTPDGGALR